MRRWRLSKKDRRRLAQRLAEQYPGYQLPEESDVEILVDEDATLYIIDGLPGFIEIGDRLVPHLALLLRRGYGWLPYLVVDEGAVKPISRGADLMRPGVREFHGDYDAGHVFVVVEPARRLPIAVQEALVPRREAEAMKKGRIGKSLHHLGDRYWRLWDKIRG